MTLKEKIIKMLKQKNIKHYSTEGEIHVFPPITNELMEFLKLIKDDNFDLLGALSPTDMRTQKEIIADDESNIHLYIRFKQNK